MADGPKQPSLTVLSGPRAGTQFLIEDVVDNVLIGSDPDCSFHIDADGVSPIHARLWVDLEGVTVYETNSPQGVFVNDDRVHEQAKLRNGDILWLGAPGGEQSTMLQVRIPPRPAKVPPPPDPVDDSGATQAFRSPFAAGGPFALGVMAEPPEDHSATVAMPRPDIVVPAAIQEADVVDPDETVGLRPPRLQSDREETGSPESTTAAVIDTPDFEAHDVEAHEVDTPDLEPPDVETIPEEAGIEAEPEESPSGEGAFSEPSSYDPDSTRALGRVSVEPEPEPEPTVTQALEVPPTPEPEPEPTMALSYHDTDPVKFDVDLPPDFSLPPPEEHAFEEDIDETVVMAHAHETETVIEPPITAPAQFVQDEIDETVVLAQPAEIETVIEPPRAAATPVAALPEARPTPSPAPEHAPTVVVPAAPPPGPSLRKEARSDAPVAAPRPSAAPPRAQPAAPRPTVRPVPAAPPVVPPAVPKAGPPASAGRGVAIGLGLLVLAGVGLGAFLLLRPTASPVTPPPSSLAAATQPPPPVSLTPAPTELPTAEPAPEPTPPVEEEVTVVPGATPPPRPSPSPSPRTAAASPVAPTRPTLPTPPAATAPPQQASVAVRVAGLMAQAQTAAASGNYDAAVAQYDEVLKLDPQNGSAQAARTTAISSRAAARKSFVTGRTVVQAGKAKANLSGFDTADVSVQKAPDFSGRLEFSMSPPKPRPGESYTLQIALVNDGKKSIKVSGLSVTTVVNGGRSGGPMTPRVREISPQQRAVLEELPGVWPPDVNSWSTEVQVSAGKDESLRGQVSWR